MQKVGRPSNRCYRIHLLWTDVPGHSALKMAPLSVRVSQPHRNTSAVITRTARVMQNSEDPDQTAFFAQTCLVQPHGLVWSAKRLIIDFSHKQLGYFTIQNKY